MVEGINPAYLDDTAIEQIKDVFEKEGAMVLKNFLQHDVHVTKKKHEYDPMKHKLALCTVDAKTQNLLSSDAFIGHIHRLTKGVGLAHQVCMFGTGDYTVLHDETIKEGIGFVLCLDDFDPAWGGSLCYKDAQDNVSKITPERNSLVLVDYDRVLEYVEFVNHHAKGHVTFIMGVLRKE